MRGKGSAMTGWFTVYRITPAYAGKSLTTATLDSFSQDHPRLCGEKFTHLRAFFHFVGSPPPMRGKVKSSLYPTISKRITPAYAGKRIDACDASNVLWDHPRLCGEKSLQKRSVMWRAGSPPPMRGKVYLRHQRRGTSKDHPRLCGEKSNNGSKCKSQSGSPPPMRGKVAAYSATDSRLRITPAYAGKSSTSLFFTNCL